MNTPNASPNEAQTSSPHAYQWSRHGWLPFPPPRHEDPARLIYDAPLRATLERLARLFRDGRENFEALRLPWRSGLLLSGPAGQGKTAATRALALFMGKTTPYITVDSSEITGAGALQKALSDLLTFQQTLPAPRIVVLDQIDQMIARMETQEFFSLLDHALARSEGTLWVGTTRHAELLPKTQSIRPGRFDRSLRFEGPSLELREVLLRNLPLGLSDENSFRELLELSEGLTYAHFEELRQICAGLLLEGREHEIPDAVRSHMRDQLISGDREGGVSDSTSEVNRRVTEVDPRVLRAALDMTDVIEALMEKTLDAAFEKRLESPGEADA